MKKRHPCIQRKQKKWILLCFLLSLASLPILTASAAEHYHKQVSLPNVNSIGYLQMEADPWNPLCDTASAVTTTAAPQPATPALAEVPPLSIPQAENPAPYPSEWNLSTDCSVIRTTYDNYDGTPFFALSQSGMVKNVTDTYSNTQLLEESQLPPAFKIAVNDQPQVLIMHTHTTETYEPEVREHYDPNFNYRTTDNSKNVVAVGDAIAAQLEAAGISYIHDTTVHDYPSYNGAYERSAETVSGILAEHPSIKVVLDIHRDAICTDTTLAQPFVEINGREAAQIMIIAGCDDGTMGMPNHLLNFRFACHLQETLETMYPGFTRPILFDYRKYNQDLTTGSLLIEVGSHGNTVDQAIYAGQLIGSGLADLLLRLK